MRTFIWSTAVLALIGATAHAGIITTVSFRYTVTLGTCVVDVYKTTMTATGDTENKVGAVLLGFGDEPNVDVSGNSIRVTPNIGDDPFQAWVRYGSSSWHKNPCIDDIDPNEFTDPSAVAADTHFLLENAEFIPAIITPAETNDGSEYLSLVQDPSPEDGFGLRVGLGGLYVQASVTAADRQHSMDIAQVGVLRGTTVYLWSASADSGGNVTEDSFLAPEPATLTLLGLGAAVLVRRRR